MKDREKRREKEKREKKTHIYQNKQRKEKI